MLTKQACRRSSQICRR